MALRGEHLSGHERYAAAAFVTASKSLRGQNPWHGARRLPAPKAREDPSARMLPTGYVFFLLGASLAMLVLCGIQCKSTFCRTPVRYGGVGSDTIISVSDDPDDEGFEMSGSSSMV